MLQQLKKSFYPIAPEIILSNDSIEIKKYQFQLPSQFYLHKSYGYGRIQNLPFLIGLIYNYNLPYQNKIIRLKNQKDYHKYKAITTYSIPSLIKIEDSIYFYIPIILPKEHKQFALKYNSKPNNTDDFTITLASIIEFWNIIQHFYYYKYQISEKTNTILMKSIIELIASNNAANYFCILKKMGANLRDNHVSVEKIELKNNNELVNPPFLVGWIEGKYLITRITSDSLTEILEEGNEIIAVNGKNVKKIVDSLNQYVSSATPQSWYYRIPYLLTEEKNNTTSLTISRVGKNDTTLYFNKKFRVQIPGLYLYPKLDKFFEINDSIWYVNLSKISYFDFKKKIKKLKQAKGIVFDIRNYPRLINSNFIRHLIDTPIFSCKMAIPGIIYPDNKYLYFATENDTSVAILKPQKPKLNAKCVFLTSGATISKAETFIDYIKNNKIGVIIGEPTGGTNGEITQINLFNRFSITFTNMIAIRSDNQPFMANGITPDIYFCPTIKGISNKEDEMLQKSIEYLTQSNK